MLLRIRMLLPLLQVWFEVIETRSGARNFCNECSVDLPLFLASPLLDMMSLYM